MSNGRRANVLAEARIRCQGRLHHLLLVGTTDKPKLVLCDHRDTQSESIMEALGGKPCRCRQIRKTWSEIIQGPGCTISHPGARRTGPLRYSSLPASFRDLAQRARAVHLERRKTTAMHWTYDIYHDKMCRKNEQSTWHALLHQNDGDQHMAKDSFFRLLRYRLSDSIECINNIMRELYAPNAPLSFRFGFMIYGGDVAAHRANPSLNILYKYTPRTKLTVNVALADLLRAHLRTGCLARQPDGKMVAVISIPKQVWQRPYRGIPATQATLAWVVRQWRGDNWTMTQALLRRDNEEWKVDQWL